MLSYVCTVPFLINAKSRKNRGIENIMHNHMLFLDLLGLPERNGNQHSAEIAEFALSLLAMMKEQKFDHVNNPVLALKIGINTGNYTKRSVLHIPYDTL